MASGDVTHALAMPVYIYNVHVYSYRYICNCKRIYVVRSDPGVRHPYSASAKLPQ